MDSYESAKTYGSETEAKKAGASYKTDAMVKDASTWWLIQDKKGSEARSKTFTEYCRVVLQSGEDRERAYIRHARSYENVELNSLTGVDYATALVRQTILGTGLITLNVVAACIDTLAAKISKNKPVPEFQTSGGSWKNQMKARRLNRWVSGFFYETKIYKTMKQVFVDSEVFGKGALQIFKKNGRLAVERVLPSELYVDEADGMYGKPRQLLRRKLVQREVLAAAFPEKADAILKMPRASTLSSLGPQGSQVMVEVWEGWHLPSSKAAGDGVHIIAIEGCELYCEEWKVECFPFVFLSAKDRVIGFWGKGTAEALMGIQLELNRLIRSVSMQLQRKGKGQVFVEHGSKVQPSHLTNGIGDIVFYTGKPPTWNNSNIVSQEEFAQIDRLYQKAFQEVGISELSAAARKPSGLDAAVALREYSDIESERFALKHQAWDQSFLDVTSTSIELITTQWPDVQKDYKVKAPGRRKAYEVDWKDIDLQAENFVMQMFPASSLPQTPAARKQFVKELEADGMISKAVAKRLLDFPDVEAEMDLGNAALDDVDATISSILDEQKPVLRPPEPYQQLDLLLERTLSNYLFCRHFDDIEQERLDMLRNLLDMTTNLIKASQQPPPMQAPQGLPPGAPPAPQMPSNNINVSGPQVNMPPAPAVPPIVAG